MPLHLSGCFIVADRGTLGVTTSKALGCFDCAEADNQFRQLFLDNPRLPGVTAAHIDAAIKSMKGSYKRNGYVYFGLDDRFLLEFCSHYLNYGSEYLGSLATHIEIDTGHPAKSELIRTGFPTVFVVDVPTAYFTNDDLRELGIAALHAWAYRLLHKKTRIWQIDFSPEISRAIEPKFVVGHYHPECVPDPSGGRPLYRYKAYPLLRG